MLLSEGKGKRSLDEPPKCSGQGDTQSGRGGEGKMRLPSRSWWIHLEKSTVELPCIDCIHTHTHSISKFYCTCKNGGDKKDDL